MSILILVYNMHSIIISFGRGSWSHAYIHCSHFNHVYFSGNKQFLSVARKKPMQTLILLKYMKVGPIYHEAEHLYSFLGHYYNPSLRWTAGSNCYRCTALLPQCHKFNIYTAIGTPYGTRGTFDVRWLHTTNNNMMFPLKLDI